MLWYGIYLIVAAFVAMATFVAAGWFREERAGAPEFPGVMSALAGVLWPVLFVGVSEMVLVWCAFRAARYAPLELLPLT